MRKIKTTLLIVFVFSLTVLSCSKNTYVSTDDNNPLLEDIKRDGVRFQKDLLESQAVFCKDNSSDSLILTEVK